jgi:hypothetical protein
MVKILQRLTVGLKVVVDEDSRFRDEAILRHQMKLDPQVSERTKSLEKHEPSLALEVSPDEEDLDRIFVRHTRLGSTPFMNIHTRGNDGDLVSGDFIIAHKAKLRPLSPGNEPAS